MTIWKPDLTPFKGPRYQAIADAIESDIKSGRIGAGFQMPTHRDLADFLNVTVGTITRGYAEAARRGLLRGETGRGTYVAGNQPTNSWIKHNDDTPKDAVDMGMTLPLNHLDPDLSSTFKELSEDVDLQSTLHYYPSRGRHLDRETAVKWLKKHYIETTTDQVLLTAGGQHAIATVLSALFRPGDSIAVERITYPLLKTMAHRFNLKLVPVEMDEQGMIPESLEHIYNSQKIRGIYCMPTCQNPTSALMSLTRRMEIADIANMRNIFVIEDDAYALLHNKPFVPIYNLAPERTLYIASLSKAVSSGLRFGYLVAPGGVYNRLAQAIADTIWMASPVCARIARHWIENGIADHVIKQKQDECIRRTNLTKEILNPLSVQSQPTAYFIWLELPEPWNSTDFARQASEHKVIVTPHHLYTVGRANNHDSFVRIAISGPRDINDLKSGLTVIKQLLEEEDYDILVH